MKKCLVLFVIYGVLAMSCHKKGSQSDLSCGIPCPLEVTVLKFRVVDKQSGQDYFFSNPAKYPISALHVRGVQDTADASVYPDSPGRYFIVKPLQEPGTYFYNISIDGLKPDTVQFGLEFASINPALSNAHSCCAPEFYIGQVRLNGESEPDEISDTSVLEIGK
jgi:hypothetical protein